MNEVQLDITRAEVAERILKLNGEPYSLREYPMFVDILNSPSPRRLMRSGRQVSKTTTMGADLTVAVVEEPYTSCLYCNSSQAQTRSFSNSKLSPFIHQSPLVYHTFFEGKLVIDNVFEKRFNNLSSIEMSYFCDDADRVRGKSARCMYLDEVQDMIQEAMIDAEECLSAASHPKIMYAGTSKSMLTPLENLWQLSTKKEWLIPCSGCGKYNRPGRKNIGKSGLICSNCGKLLDTYSGFWYSFADGDNGREPFVDGYWIPQIIMPMHCCSETKWQRLLEKLETYPDAKFDNEVLGLPNGEGEMPITEDMLKSMCVDTLEMTDRPPRKIVENAHFMVAGIDWGGNGFDKTSRTTMHIYAVGGGPSIYTCVYGKIYDIADKDEMVQDMAKTIRKYRVCDCFCDHGMSNNIIQDLRGKLNGIPCTPIYYSGNALSGIKWVEAAHRYTVNKTVVIDEFFRDMMRGNIRAMRWKDFRPFAEDILNERVEEKEDPNTGKRTRTWKHISGRPDDSLHSMVFGWIGARIKSGRGNFEYDIPVEDRDPEMAFE